MHLSGEIMVEAAVTDAEISAGVVLEGQPLVDVAEGAMLTFSGNMTGAGSLTKTGSGTLVLAGENGYAGVTTIAAGMLLMGSDDALPSGVGKGDSGQCRCSGPGRPERCRQWTYRRGAGHIQCDRRGQLDSRKRR